MRRKGPGRASVAALSEGSRRWPCAATTALSIISSGRPYGGLRNCKQSGEIVKPLRRRDWRPLKTESAMPFAGGSRVAHWGDYQRQYLSWSPITPADTLNSSRKQLLSTGELQLKQISSLVHRSQDKPPLCPRHSYYRASIQSRHQAPQSHHDLCSLEQT